MVFISIHARVLTRDVNVRFHIHGIGGCDLLLPFLKMLYGNLPMPIDDDPSSDASIVVLDDLKLSGNMG
jgi:hypothetical protein